MVYFDIFEYNLNKIKEICYYIQNINHVRYVVDIPIIIKLLEIREGYFVPNSK